MDIRELLPVGSVVLMKNAVKKLMVIGLKPVKTDEPQTEYDYIGVLFPEGYLGNESCFLFNHEDINDVVFRGYDNPERREFAEMVGMAYDAELESEKGEESAEE